MGSSQGFFVQLNTDFNVKFVIHLESGMKGLDYMVFSRKMIDKLTAGLGFCCIFNMSVHKSQLEKISIDAS